MRNSFRNRSSRAANFSIRFGQSFFFSGPAQEGISHLGPEGIRVPQTCSQSTPDRRFSEDRVKPGMVVGVRLETIRDNCPVFFQVARRNLRNSETLLGIQGRSKSPSAALCKSTPKKLLILLRGSTPRFSSLAKPLPTGCRFGCRLIAD